MLSSELKQWDFNLSVSITLTSSDWKKARRRTYQQFVEIPSTSGVYIAVSENKEVYYVGSSVNLYQRVNNSNNLRRVQCHDDKFDIYYFECSNYNSLEYILIDALRPIFNTHGKN